MSNIVDLIQDEFEADEAFVHRLAPPKAEIAALENIAVLNDIISDAQDTIISIELQLQYLNDGDYRLKVRRVAALIFWKQAEKNAKRRIVEIQRGREAAKAAA